MITDKFKKPLSVHDSVILIIKGHLRIGIIDSFQILPGRNLAIIRCSGQWWSRNCMMVIKIPKDAPILASDAPQMTDDQGRIPS